MSLLQRHLDRALVALYLLTDVVRILPQATASSNAESSLIFYLYTWSFNGASSRSLPLHHRQSFFVCIYCHYSPYQPHFPRESLTMKLIQSLLFAGSASAFLAPRSKAPAPYVAADSEHAVPEGYIVRFHANHTLEDHFMNIGFDVRHFANRFMEKANIKCISLRNARKQQFVDPRDYSSLPRSPTSRPRWISTWWTDEGF